MLNILKRIVNIKNFICVLLIALLSLLTISLFCLGFGIKIGIWIGSTVQFLALLISSVFPFGMADGNYEQIYETDEDIIRKLENIVFDEYSYALSKKIILPKNISMKLSESEYPEAFPIVKNGFCITRGLLKLEDTWIKCLIAHAFYKMDAIGRFMRSMVKHSALILDLLIGFVFKTIVEFFKAMLKNSMERDAMGIVLVPFLVCLIIPFYIPLKLWEYIEARWLIVVEKIEDYMADKYVVRHGLGKELYSIIEETENKYDDVYYFWIYGKCYDFSKRLNRIDKLNKKYLSKQN